MDRISIPNPDWIYNMFSRIKTYIVSIERKWKLRKDYKRISRYRSIKPRPYLSHLSMCILYNVPCGNIMNLDSLLNMTIKCNDLNEYMAIDDLYKQHFISGTNVYYRNYFITIDNNTQVIIDPIKVWSDIISSVWTLLKRKQELNETARDNPDNYYIISVIDKIVITAEKFTAMVEDIETSK